MIANHHRLPEPTPDFPASPVKTEIRSPASQAEAKAREDRP